MGGRGGFWFCHRLWSCFFLVRSSFSLLSYKSLPVLCFEWIKVLTSEERKLRNREGPGSGFDNWPGHSRMGFPPRLTLRLFHPELHDLVKITYLIWRLAVTRLEYETTGFLHTGMVAFSRQTTAS